jgi:hypothetical protein
MPSTAATSNSRALITLLALEAAGAGVRVIGAHHRIRSMATLADDDGRLLDLFEPGGLKAQRPANLPLRHVPLGTQQRDSSL